MCGSAAILSPRSLAHAASPPHRSICLALSPSTLAACPPSESTAASLCSSPACTVHAGFPVVPRCPSCWHHSQLMVQPSAPPLPCSLPGGPPPLSLPRSARNRLWFCAPPPPPAVYLMAPNTCCCTPAACQALLQALTSEPVLSCCCSPSILQSTWWHPTASSPGCGQRTCQSRCSGALRFISAYTFCQAVAEGRVDCAAQVQPPFVAEL